LRRPTPQSFALAKTKALFLDRDGVINVDHGYVHTVDNFQFIKGILNLAKAAHFNNFKLVVVTNQSGIGRGFYTENQFHQITSWMCREFIIAGAPITKVYFSPFHPSQGIGKYKKDDFSRKPNPGMILQAKQELDLDLDNSLLIGDKVSDIQAGITPGIGHNILYSTSPVLEVTPKKCHVITSLLEALPFINKVGSPLVLK